MRENREGQLRAVICGQIRSGEFAPELFNLARDCACLLLVLK